jgi:AcrR family transcriptional regulator
LSKLKKAPSSLDDAHHHGQPASVASRNERSFEVVSAAYSLIAEKGFEGLRTREVADKVGINSATLHYYFPTKEALIQGVVEHLMQELRTSRAKPRDPQSALDRLRAEFADLRLRLREAPEQLAVLTELAVRAWRDPAIARMLQYLDDGWRGHLTSILEAGIAEGVFRADLEVVATADAMMSQLRGLGYQGKLGGKKMDSLIAHIAIQTEYWVRARPQLARRGARP